MRITLMQKSRYDTNVEKPLSLHKKVKFLIKAFFSNCDQICIKVRILKKALLENFTFCAVCVGYLILTLFH